MVDFATRLELQRDPFLATGVDGAYLYDRPGLAARLRALRDGDTLVI